LFLGVLFCVAADTGVHQKELVRKRFEPSDVLKNFDSIKGGTPKRFPRSTLGIVTPWNYPEGLAENWGQKFTYISHIWFHIQPFLAASEDCPADAADAKKCGAADNFEIRVGPVQKPDMDLVKALKEKGAKVVPIFAFYGWTREALSVFFFGKDSGGAQHRVVRKIVEACREVDCDGIHLEWGAMPVKDYFKEGLEGWLRRLRGSMRKALGHNSQTLMLSVHPDPAHFSQHEFGALLPIVDKFVLHLYNFTGPAMAEGPGTPMPWMKDMLKAWNLFKRVDAEDRVIATLPFFGREYRFGQAVDLDEFAESRRAVDGDGKLTRWDVTGTDYINALMQAKETNMKITWNREYEENYLTWETFKDAGSTELEERSIWFPSLQSLNNRIELLKDTQACGLGIYNVGSGLDYFLDLI